MNHEISALPEAGRVKWLKSDRYELKSEFTLNGSAGKIFPLLCPVREFEWLPGWECRMVRSESGVAEKDCVFITREAPGRTAVWTCVTYEPPAFIEYLVASGRDAVMRLSIRLAEKEDGLTGVDWRMLFTAFSHIGRAVIRRRFPRKKFDAMMRARERELNWYLAHGTMINI